MIDRAIDQILSNPDQAGTMLAAAAADLALALAVLVLLTGLVLFLLAPKGR